MKTRSNRWPIGGVAAALLWVVPTDAMAQSCTPWGVPVVNQATTELGAAVTAYMAAGTAEVIAWSEFQTERIISGLRVGVAQTAVSGDQVSTTAMKSNEAAANAYVASRQAMQALEESERYGSLGYSACAVPAASSQFYSAYVMTYEERQARRAARQAVAARPGEVSDPAGWFSAVRGAGDATAQALFDGDAAQAAVYMNTVMGPPDQMSPNLTEVERAAFLARKLNRDAARSVALHVMEEITAENAPNGPAAAMDALMATWVGTDGGAQWAESMAASHERGILLDAVRIEAANLASLAMEIQKAQRSELVTAAYALARAQELIDGQQVRNP